MQRALAPFTVLRRNHYGAILADPSWNFATWSARGRDRSSDKHYRSMTLGKIAALPVRDLAAEHCVLFLWATWPMLEQALFIIEQWGFKYKTNAFCWMKTNKNGTPFKGLGYWTRANTEPCLLATKGKPRRQYRGVPQAILEPRREHSRKPDCIYDRIEQLVDGPYTELFARACRLGWDAWGDEINKFNC